ncbi:hypothetical protein ACFWPV_25735 [Streptomyces uncialis]|uniref:hypothetical protein n=1 Tax=Streptomyces uncialis TaxID=1048205 RepID=UPI00365AC451
MSVEWTEVLLLVITARVLARDGAAAGRLLLGAGVRAGAQQLAREDRRAAAPEQRAGGA